jgi:8-oxo-dGTP pyrophosphatase MutT (NUDIX family)
VSIARAATVVLLRTQPHGLEVYLVQRHQRSGFWPTAHVFPGGRLEPSDGDDDDAPKRAAVRESAEECGIRPVVDELVVIGRWVTPAQESRRYDTYFYAAHIDHVVATTAQPDGVEVTAGLWITPHEATRRGLACELIFAPPTMAMLEDLCRCTSWSDVMAYPWTLSPVEPVLVRSHHETIIALPGDVLHPITQRAFPHRTRLAARSGQAFCSENHSKT